MEAEKNEHESHMLDQDAPVADSYQQAPVDNGISVDDYKTCTDLPFTNHGDLHVQNPKKLALNVIRVVEAEGPIHFDEMVKRIRSLWGLRRTGDRIINALRKSVDVAKTQGEIKARGAFLWPRDLKTPKVRKRNEEPRPDIKLICPEEIKEEIPELIEELSPENNYFEPSISSSPAIKNESSISKIVPEEKTNPK